MVLSRRGNGGKSDVSRKVIHVGAGNSILLWPLYEHAWAVSIAPWTLAVFVFLLTPKSRVKAFRDMFLSMARERDLKRGHIVGPFAYIISIGLLVSVFGYGSYYPYFFIGAIGIMIMIWGDGFACLIGKRFGKSSQYEVFGCTRSVVGSLTLFIVGSIVSLLTMFYFSSVVPMIRPAYTLPVALPLPTMLEIALLASLVATIIEAITPLGLDNLTVPLLTSLTVFIAFVLVGVVIPVKWEWFVQ
jgi:dolichol kinase